MNFQFELKMLKTDPPSPSLRERTVQEPYISQYQIVQIDNCGNAFNFSPRIVLFLDDETRGDNQQWHAAVTCVLSLGSQFSSVGS